MHLFTFACYSRQLMPFATIEFESSLFRKSLCIQFVEILFRSTRRYPTSLCALWVTAYEEDREIHADKYTRASAASVAKITDIAYLSANTIVCAASLPSLFQGTGLRIGPYTLPKMMATECYLLEHRELRPMEFIITPPRSENLRRPADDKCLIKPQEMTETVTDWWLQQSPINPGNCTCGLYKIRSDVCGHFWVLPIPCGRKAAKKTRGYEGTPPTNAYGLPGFCATTAPEHEIGFHRVTKKCPDCATRHR
ncbi:hypothetical protein GGR57DRAFT_227197 [Xylariaceae sp. FL1272]|nr:hypothetical protein GGR57DRAFT_227197 [Xylariaceae sp. FL1272]